jgi:hypothetical protein
MVYRRWLVLLCKFNDVTTEPHDRSWYDALFTNNDDGEANPGMYNFFKDVSYGAENNLPTEIHGWYTMGLQSQPFGVLYRSVPGQACVQAAGIDTSAYAKIITVFNAPNDSGFDGGAVEGDSGTDQGFFAHELGHAYGLHHAFDDSPRSCGAAPGEYCDGYDTMGNEYYSFWSMFGHSGPAYSLPERRALGWVPAGREMLLMGQATPQTQTVQIASSSRPESNGALLVRVRPPYSTDDTHYFSIELTQRDNGFYQAIPRDGIVIREYTGATPRPPAFGEPGQNAWTSYLKAWGRDDNWGRPPDVLVGETYTSDVMTVTPLSIDSAGGFATVQITY